MAEARRGRPSKESVNIAKELNTELGNLLDVSNEIDDRLAKIFRLDQSAVAVAKKYLNSKKTGLKVDDNAGKAAIKRVKAEQTIGKLTNEQLKGAFETLDAGKKILKNARAFITVLLTNPFLAIGAAILLAGKFLFDLVKDAQELRREFGFTLVEATKLAGALKAAEFAARGFMLESDDVKNTFRALAKTFGEVNLQTVGFSLELSRAARNIGLGNEEAVTLLANITGATGQSKDLALNTLQTIGNLARMEGVAPGVVLQDLANSADEFASFIGRGEKNLIKAAAAARKVGLEFGDIVKFGDDLLNITDRLEKEQTLSIITGRQIRLDRVAILTSQNRMAEAQRELATQLRAVQGLTAQQIRFAAQTVNMDVNALLKLVQLGESSLREQKKFNMNQMN